MSKVTLLKKHVTSVYNFHSPAPDLGKECVIKARNWVNKIIVEFIFLIGYNYFPMLSKLNPAGYDPKKLFSNMDEKHFFQSPTRQDWFPKHSQPIWNPRKQPTIVWCNLVNMMFVVKQVYSKKHSKSTEHCFNNTPATKPLGQCMIRSRQPSLLCLITGDLIRILLSTTFSASILARQHK